jgi:hypothetical protein
VSGMKRIGSSRVPPPCCRPHPLTVVAIRGIARRAQLSSLSTHGAGYDVGGGDGTEGGVDWTFGESPSFRPPPFFVRKPPPPDHLTFVAHSYLFIGEFSI